MRNFFNPRAWLIILFLLLSNTVYAESPSLFFSNAPKQVEEGDRVSVDIRVKSTSQSINAISGAVSFPESLLRVVSISKDKSIINLWTEEPKAQRNKIVFEGVILNPGFQGANGQVLHITFETKGTGIAPLGFSEAAILANDGLGSNIIATLGSTSLKIIEKKFLPDNQVIVQEGGAGGEGRKLAALPVITEYSVAVNSTEDLRLKGKGEPNALTKIVFKDVSIKSVGERLIGLLQTKKKKLDEVLVKNDATGAFEYTSAKNLVAGVYNATPFLVDNDNNTEKPGLGVQLLVSDSKIVKALVVLINVLGLLIPVVGLAVIIYFIPWYSFRRMRVLKKKMGLEEEKLELSGHQLERQDKLLDQSIDKIAGNPPTDH